jgi:hypothetical protein
MVGDINEELFAGSGQPTTTSTKPTGMFDDILNDLDTAPPQQSRRRPMFSDPELQLGVSEHENSVLLNGILPQIDMDDGFDVNQINEKEERIKLLERCNSLFHQLEKQDDLSYISRPNENTSLGELRSVHSWLQIKANRLRSRMIARELFVVGAKGLEKIFDGKRDYFGYSPDLTDWSQTVNVKMAAMDDDIAMIANDAMDYMGAGPLTRMALALAPSAFLHSATRRKNHGENAYQTTDWNSAIDSIRDAEDY